MCPSLKAERCTHTRLCRKNAKKQRKKCHINLEFVFFNLSDALQPVLYKNAHKIQNKSIKKHSTKRYMCANQLLNSQ